MCLRLQGPVLLSSALENDHHDMADGDDEEEGE
jgi:hypothetical protein